jgi:hypothetical protein
MLARIAATLVALMVSSAFFYAALIYLPQREAARAAAQQVATIAAQLEVTREAQREAARVEQLEAAREAQRDATRAAHRQEAMEAQTKAVKAALAEARRELEAVLAEVQRETERNARLEVAREAQETLRNSRECSSAAWALHERHGKIAATGEFQGFY